MTLFRKLSLALALVAVLVGAFPPSRVQAFQLPPVVAPPITGMCATPYGAIMCFVTGGGIGSWVTNAGGISGGTSLVGIGPYAPDGSWCMTDSGHMFDTASASCNPAVAVETPGGTIDQVGEQFTPSDPEDFDALGSYIWLPTGEPCYEGICVTSAVSRQIDRSVEWWVDVDGSGGNACEGGDIQHGLSPSGAAITNSFDTPCYFAAPVRLFAGWPNAGGLGYLTGATNAGGNCGFPISDSRWFTSLTGDGVSLVEHEVYGGAPGTCKRVMVDDGVIGHIGIFEMNSSGTITDWGFIQVARQGVLEGEYRTTTACQAEDGTVTIRETTGPETFVVGAAAGTLPDLGCLPGEIPISSQVDLCDANSEVCLGVADWTLPPEAEPYLECIQAMSTPNPCPMWLEYYTGTGWEECEPAVAGPCTDWWTNPGRDVLFRCGWGGDYLAASQCQLLQDWYNHDDPDSEADLPIIDPNNPSDPSTDAPIGEPDPDTGLLPGTITGPGTPPAARPSTGWWTTVVAEWSSGSTANWQGACWPQGWGLLNPLQWVMRPIICAMTFLFVPTTDLETRLEAWRVEQAQSTKLGLIFDAVELVSDIPSPVVGGNCGWGLASVEGGNMTFPEVQIILCPSDFDAVSAAASTRTWSTGAVGLMAVGMVFRWVALARAGPGEEGEQLSLF